MKGLDPELIAMRAVERALADLEAPARRRVLQWACARAQMPGATCVQARLAETLRWARRSYGNPITGSNLTEGRRLIDETLAEAKA